MSGYGLLRRCRLEEVYFQHNPLAGGGELAHPTHHSQQLGDLLLGLVVVGAANDENFVTHSFSLRFSLRQELRSSPAE